MNAIYTAEATAWGGRNGRAASSDGNLDVILVPPKELGGPGGEGTNPEQLFAAGYAGCFHNAMLLVARSQKLDISESAVTAKVGLGDNGQGGFGMTVTVHAEIPGLDQDKAEELVAATEKVCPFSNATRGNVGLKLEVTTGD